jgi:rRNA pseudouridine-1189 N-methylase Emg1 (Nep1/Mra1 family)
MPIIEVFDQPWTRTHDDTRARPAINHRALRYTTDEIHHAL